MHVECTIRSTFFSYTHEMPFECMKYFRRCYIFYICLFNCEWNFQRCLLQVKLNKVSENMPPGCQCCIIGNNKKKISEDCLCCPHQSLGMSETHLFFLSEKLFHTRSPKLMALKSTNDQQNQNQF